MEVINQILQHPQYKKALKELEPIEKQRIYCKHGLNHFLDVARIGYILVLENNSSITKEVMYACGLLHDIGRYLEYKNGIPHEEASSTIAKKILEKIDFSLEEKESITNAILNHRLGNSNDELSTILYRADKLSRNCFNCQSRNTCYWDDQKKNLHITY